jgi:hypothetical protein
MDKTLVNNTEFSEYMANLDYREGFNSGEAHVLYWLKEFLAEGYTLAQALDKYELRDEAEAGEI